MRSVSDYIESRDPWTSAESSVKEEAIFKEIEMCAKNRDTLEKALLVLSSTPLIAIFALMVSRAATGDGATLGMQVVFLAAPILYLFILYNIVKYMTKMVRLNSYLGYLEDLLTAHHCMRDVLIWHREINIEEKYSFTGSLFQIPFHLAALALLAFASVQAHPAVWSAAFPVVIASDVMMAVLVVCILLMGVAAAMAHWDTKTSINKDRVRNRLTPMPPYYADFWSYLRIYRLEKGILAKVRKAREKDFGEMSEDYKRALSLSGSSDTVGSQDGLRYLGVRIALAIEEGSPLPDRIVNKDDVSRDSVYVPVSMMNIDTLMAIWQDGSDEKEVHALLSLMIPVKAGDFVVIWDNPGKYGGETKPLALAKVERVCASL